MKSNTASATTATDSIDAAARTPRYVGRFAPSPSGDLHLGSLLTATASYLDARAQSGQWLLRIEDLDKPREIPGAADRILTLLEAFGFEWDGEPVYQSRRLDLYEAALALLAARDDIYACGCSRRDLEGMDRYPGTCRNRSSAPAAPAALRLRTGREEQTFTDRVQGPQRQNAADSGDFIVKRRDGIFAYALAVVVDDARQGVTHVVRGADLLAQTGAQMGLQHRLGLSQPAYAHVPVLVESDGAKLAKSKHSLGLDTAASGDILYSIFKYLGMNPPNDIITEGVAACWRWAVPAWRCEQVPRHATLLLSI